MGENGRRKNGRMKMQAGEFGRGKNDKNILGMVEKAKIGTKIFCHFFFPTVEILFFP